MSALKNKKIVLGITGSIAAYKSAVLTRLLVKAGAEVKVVMTPSAADFITPLTLSVLSKNPVLQNFSTPQGEWNNHVELGLWGDALLIAPGSANTLAKMANGICDNLLLAVYLSARCPVFFAPAMDLDMLKHPATQENLNRIIKSNGNFVITPGYGELASGLVGDGRMAEPEEIITQLENFFSAGQPLAGKVALVTSGPTYEAIDPVRFVGNHSTGKMGFAIAEALAAQGAQVNLVTGPTQLHTNHSNINVKHVVSSEEMYEACVNVFPSADITVLAAAVADYKPAIVAEQKIKKNENGMTLELTKTKDIAASLGKLKHNGQIIVGFALETENEQANALKKLESKNFDLIVLNSLNDKGAGFGHDTNKITIIDKKQQTKQYDLKPKQEVAVDIVSAIKEIIQA